MPNPRTTPECPKTGYAAATGYNSLGCRCAICRAWYAEYSKRRKPRRRNTEKDRERHKKYYRENRLKVAAKRQNIRAYRRGATGTCSQENLEARIDYYGRRCSIKGCDNPFEQIDHSIPLSRGGSNWPANLRPMCKDHNQSKGSKTLGEFLTWLGNM